MPFINEEDFQLLNNELETAKEQNDLLVKDYESLESNLKKNKKIGLRTNIIFGALAGLSIGLASYVFNNRESKISFFTSKSVDVNAIKSEERLRIIDSINTVFANNDHQDFEDSDDEYTDNDSNTGSEDTNINDSKDKLRNVLSNKKVYSVQIGVFSENKFPTLTESIAGIVTEEEYFKYSIGIFEDIDRARQFRKDLVRIGFDDAFIASYVNGRRQEIIRP